MCPADFDKSLDVLGVKPVAKSIEHVTQVTTNGAASFLAKICMPAAEEFGLLLRDKIRHWRAGNATKIVAHAEKLAYENSSVGLAHPRLVAAILENGSWTDNDELQKIWAGLLISSCCEDGNDDSNLIFISLLSHLTQLQAKIISYSCVNIEKTISSNGLVAPLGKLSIAESDIKAMCGTKDLERIDREIDNLRGLELIEDGIQIGNPIIYITPTALALNLYARCHGYTGPLASFYGIKRT